MNDYTLRNFLRGYESFLIPNYQRDYAWEERNFEELWEDLEESIELADRESLQDKGHFLGTIVISPTESNNKKRIDVIDGQQRLTTTFMLLIALWERLSDNERMYRGKDTLYNGNDYKLQVSQSNRDFFKCILENAQSNNLPSETQLALKPSTQGQYNLYKVFNCILGKVGSFDTQEACTYFTKLLDMRLICFSEQNAGVAIRTFQSVNDRGVPLRLLDKLKSLLIYYSNRYCNDEKLDCMINDSFGEIFGISMRIFNHPYRTAVFATQSNEIDDIERDVFRYHLGSRTFENFEKSFLGTYKESAETHYVRLKQAIKALAQQDKEKLNVFLSDYSDDLKAFFHAMLRIFERINEDKDCAMFKAIMIENLNPMYYNTFVRLEIDDKLNEEMITLFTKADCILTKMNGKLKDPYDLIKDYKDKDSVALAQSIKDKVKNTKGINVENNINDFVENTYNQTHKKVFHYLFIERECREVDIGHLLQLLDKEDKERGKKVNQEMEHIISQSVYENDDINTIKAKDFSDKDELGRYINTYGNFLSLEKAYNAKASNNGDEHKKEVYKKSALPFVVSFDPKKVNKDFIKERNEEMKKYLKTEFFKDFL
ncbi:DUF262 domain-containing HNH endonuclease family protein [Helicobacter sp. MIT 21-1697]|uniref:DUF262 domain-containing protein n=1 Tax=Helicobacter sp. MIT 21-1697 TaxID=2993733 RepID=UPI00224A7B4D|nr:DUF262 domain-containing HNH endonuclease family protein [Helicobacter sp. MIT 21-1697]MCX2717128.1 DUF262 domain-containing HNH endonuclease family protein [Helicobacter sp. MIT 21-1697]